jgi:hypothetical protein
MREFYETLFDPGEGVCWTVDAFGTGVFSVDKYALHSKAPFYSINPLLISEDRAPSRHFHSPKLGRRADINVTAYRNILVEFDELPLTEQRAYLDSTGMPYTARVYSGGKSVHTIVSLETPLKDRAEYRDVVQAMHTKLIHSDLSTSNPSRLSRSPWAMRDNGVIQELLWLGRRIPTATFLEWLGEIKRPKSYTVTDRSNTKMVNAFTHFFLTYGAPDGKWNKQLFCSVCDMVRAGFSSDEIYARLEKVTGYLDARDRSTITSALRIATNGISDISTD